MWYKLILTLLVSSYNLSGQRDEICVTQYFIRDMKLYGIIRDSLENPTIDSLRKEGFLPVLSVNSIDSCSWISRYDSINRPCVHFSLSMEFVRTSIIARKGKIAKATIDNEDIVLILNNYTGVVIIPYQSSLWVNSEKSIYRDYRKQVFSLLYNGKDYIGLSD